MGSKVTTQNITQSTSNIGAAQLPYYNTAMQGANALLTTPTARYDRDRLEGFTGQQQKLQGEIAGMQTPGQFGQATNLANQAGVAALNAGNYNPAAQYQAGSYNPAAQYQGGNYGPAAQYQGANYGPAAQYDPTKFTSQQIQDQNLTRYQMADAEQFGNAQAQQYMNPYMQNVVDVQKRKAQEDAQKSQLMQNLGASRQGTYGGSRQLLAGLNRERDLGRQMGDIQATGLQSAYSNAQEQFERDRAAGMSVKDANLKAQLSVQDLEARNNLQSRLANQQYDFEAQKAGEASRQFGADFGEKSRQFGADLGERSRQFGADLGEKSRQFGADFGEKSRQFGTEFGERSRLEAAKFGEASRQFGTDFNERSRQFGASQGLAGAQAAGNMAQTLSNIGQTQQNADAQRLGMQQSTAAQQQALNQQMRDLDYADFQKEADDPYTRLQRYMGLMSGVPQNMTTTSTQSAPSPGLAQQLAGAGLGAYSTYKMFSGG